MNGVGDLYKAAEPAAALNAAMLEGGILMGAIIETDAVPDGAIKDGLGQLALYQDGMTYRDAITALGTVPALTQKYYATASLLVDQTVKAEKNATGITPIVSVNIQPIEMLNIAIKYEHLTKIEFTNTTTSDVTVGLMPDGTPVTMFPDGAKTRLDMPALLAVGVTLRPIEKLLLAGGFTSYMDKGAVWGTEENNRTEQLSGNSWDMGIGAEYSLSEKFLVSAGYSMTTTGATPEYQTDLSHSLSTKGGSFGIAWNILPKLQLNLGGQIVAYEDASKTFTSDFGIGTTSVTEDYKRSVWVAAIGINYSLSTGN